MNFNDLNLDESGDEDYKPEKIKKTRKNEIVESSEEEADYVPVKECRSKRKSTRNEITP